MNFVCCSESLRFQSVNCQGIFGIALSCFNHTSIYTLFTLLLNAQKLFNSINFGHSHFLGQFTITKFSYMIKWRETKKAKQKPANSLGKLKSVKLFNMLNYRVYQIQDIMSFVSSQSHLVTIVSQCLYMYNLTYRRLYTVFHKHSAVVFYCSFTWKC